MIYVGLVLVFKNSSLQAYKCPGQTTAPTTSYYIYDIIQGCDIDKERDRESGPCLYPDIYHSRCVLCNHPCRFYAMQLIKIY